MDHERERREELGRFLRARRQRISPELVGLPGGTRRRTPGLRREEIAVLAGLSPSWYAYLEQGRAINPSSSVLDSLSRVMGLTSSEHSYLYELAHVSQPIAPATTPTDENARSLAVALVRSLSEFAYPVYCFDATAEVLAANPACRTWFEGLGAGENVVRWMFLSRAARAAFVEWEREARTVLAGFRAQQVLPAVRAGNRPLVAELSAASPEFREWWQGHEVHDHTSRPRRIVHPTLGTTEVQLSMFRAVDDATVSIAFHHPREPVGQPLSASRSQARA